MIKRTGKALTLMQMARNMSANGKTINSMDLDLKRGPMVRFMKVSTQKAKNMAQEN